MSIELRNIRLDEVETLQDFICEHWSPNHAFVHSRELLVWQHYDNPFRQPAGYSDDELAFNGAFADGELVAVLGEIPIDFVLGEETIPGSWLALWKNRDEGDWAGAGIQLFHRATSGRAQIVGAIGIHPRVRKAYQLFKFRLESDLAHHVILNPRVHTDMIQIRDGVDMRDLDRFRPVMDVLDTIDETIRQGPPPPKDWDAMWTKVRAQSVGVNRTWAYMAWRYVEHPHYRYQWHCAYDDQGYVQGAAVTRVEEVGGNCVLHVLELVGIPEICSRLARHVCRHMVEMGAAFLGFRCASATVRDAFADAGGALYEIDEPSFELPSLFQPLIARYKPLIWGLRSTRGVPPFDVVDCYVTRSDGDQDRPSRIPST